MRMGVKHDLCTLSHSGPHRLGIPPPFVANHDTKCQRPGGEDLSLGTTRGIDGLFRGVELYLVLPPKDGAVWVDHTRRDLQALFSHALCPENDRDARSSCGIGDRRQRSLEESGIGRGWCGAGPAITGDETLRKTDHARALSSGVRHGRSGQVNRLLTRCRNPHIGECDTYGAQTCCRASHCVNQRSHCPR